MKIAGKYKRLFIVQLNQAKTICLPCVSNTRKDTVLLVCEISGAKKKNIEIYIVRLPVLINPASCFINRSVVRFLPESL